MSAAGERPDGSTGRSRPGSAPAGGLLCRHAERCLRATRARARVIRRASRAGAGRLRGEASPARSDCRRSAGSARVPAPTGRGRYGARRERDDLAGRLPPLTVRRSAPAVWSSWIHFYERRSSPGGVFVWRKIRPAGRRGSVRRAGHALRREAEYPIRAARRWAPADSLSPTPSEPTAPRSSVSVPARCRASPTPAARRSSPPAARRWPRGGVAPFPRPTASVRSPWPAGDYSSRRRGERQPRPRSARRVSAWRA